MSWRERERARESETFTTRHAYNRHKVHEYPSLSKNREVYLRLTMEHFKPDCRTSARGSVCKTWGASLKIVNEKKWGQTSILGNFFLHPSDVHFAFLRKLTQEKEEKKEKIPACRPTPTF